MFYPCFSFCEIRGSQQYTPSSFASFKQVFLIQPRPYPSLRPASLWLPSYLPLKMEFASFHSFSSCSLLPLSNYSSKIFMGGANSMAQRLGCLLPRLRTLVQSLDWQSGGLSASSCPVTGFHVCTHTHALKINTIEFF